MTSSKFRAFLALLLVTTCLLFSPTHSFAPPTAATSQRRLSVIPTTAASTTVLWLSTHDKIQDAAVKNDVNYGEASRKFRRTYYTHDDWPKHRTSDRFVNNLRKTFRSGIVRQLADEIALVASIATIVCVWNAVFVTGYQDFTGALHDPMWHGPPILMLPLVPYTISSPALGLLLVFRTNASYSRWKDGRVLWGSIVNHSRTILRLGNGWVHNKQQDDQDSVTGSTAQAAQLQRLSDCVWTFARSHQRNLLGPQDEDAYRQDLQTYLAASYPDFVDDLLQVRHKPTRALFELTLVIDSLPLPYFQKVEIEKSVTSLTESMGGCERIFSSPVPLVYSRHTARFLGFWILTLPLGMWTSFDHTWNHLGLVPVSILISFFFFGIDELAIQLEEPFSILPLDELVRGIRMSADEHIVWNEGVERNMGLQHRITEVPAELEGEHWN